MSRGYGPTVCVGGPMHGKVFDGGSYPQPYVETVLPSEWESAYSVRDSHQSHVLARNFLKTRYKRDWLAFKFGALVMEGDVWLWDEYKPGSREAMQASVSMLIATAFEVSR